MSRFCGSLLKLSQRNLSTSYIPKIPVSFLNVDTSLHSEEEQAILDRFSNESIKTGNVILHTFPKGTFKYGYAVTFTGKIESYLKYNKIDYVLDDKIEVQFPLPIHKIPWITYNSMHTTDSNTIIKRLNHELNINNDKHLTSEQQQISFAYNIMMDSLYWIDLYRRYIRNENLVYYFNQMFPENEKQAKQFADYAGPMVINQLWDQGISRFDGDTVYKLHIEYIDNILNYMGDKPFFFGDKICNIDFAIYSQFGSMYSLDLTYPNTKEYDGKLHRMDEVIQYLQRIEKTINHK